METLTEVVKVKYKFFDFMKEDDFEVELSEANIALNHGASFIFGHFLATVHSRGYILENLKCDSIKFSFDNCAYVVDDKVEFKRTTLSAGNMSQQFLSLFPYFKQEAIWALLAGYSQKAYQIIDPNIPGYTDSILKKFLAKPLISKLKPREKVIFLERTLEAFGCKIDPASLGLQFSSEIGPADIITDEEIILSTISLLIAGYKIHEWIAQLAIKDGQRPVVQILAAFARKDHIRNSGYSISIPGLAHKSKKRAGIMKMVKLQPYPFNILLCLIGCVYLNPDLEHENSFSEVRIFELYRSIVRSQLKPNEVEKLNEAISDSLDYIAKVSDTQDKFPETIWIIQKSIFLTQMLSENWDGAEKRLNTLECRLQSYPWTQGYLKDFNNFNICFNFIGFLGAVSLTENKIFELSAQQFRLGKCSNHLWSVAWRSIKRQRLAFSTAYLYYINNDLSKENREDFINTVSNNLKFYFEALQLHKQAVEQCHEQGLISPWQYCWSNGNQKENKLTNMQQELVAVKNIRITISSKGCNGETLAELHNHYKLIKSLEKNRFQSCYVL